jgi:hypothetical protein
MFPTNLVQEAIALATNAAERDIAINGAPNSFLDTLIGLSKNALDTSSSSMDDAGQRYDRSDTFSHLECDVHTAFADRDALASAKVIASNINTARNDAIPLIAGIMADFEKIINPDIPFAYRRRAVIPVQFNPIWSSEYVQNIAQTYATATGLGEIPQGLVLSNEEEQFTNFVELTKTGLSSVDGQLGKLLSSYEDNYLLQLFKDTFTHGSMRMVRGPDDLTDGWINDNILIHVWARNLSEMTPSKSAHGLPGYRAGITAVIARSGNNVWNINKLRENCATNGIMILAYQGDNTYVHSDIYTDWLKTKNAAGIKGSPEIILGASLLTGQLRPTKGEELLAQSVQLTEKWNNYVSMTSRSEQENLNSTARRELFILIRSRIDARLGEGLVGSYDEVILRLNDACDQLATNFIKNAYPAIRDVVLYTFYVNTDVPQFIMAMDEVCSDDDDLSEEEVASIATVNYVSDWMAKLLTIRGGSR